MAGSSPEEIARQHAEALELLRLQPLAQGPPAVIGQAIPLKHKTRPISERIVVQDMSVVTGPEYIASLQQKQHSSPQPQDDADKDANDDDNNFNNSNNENEDLTKANRLNGHEATMADESLKENENLISQSLLQADALAPYWSFRGQVDVRDLQKLVQHGYNQAPTPLSPDKCYQASDISDTKDYWDPIHAAVHNVNIKRPSHDQWGIPKIALVFSDDFVQRVFELPWWSKDDSPFRQAIQPILDTLNIRRNQIVRLLLASLPPGTTIPIHFDSGEWVTSTHRVHVPVLVNRPEDILFRCGPDLQRIPTRPGYVLEINNQSWHAVSNCDSDHRVHLILDYVDDDEDDKIVLPRQRLTLGEGEVLRQTRRSVDRAVDAGKRPAPSFLIIGAQKAGTTSLYEALMQHPLLARPKKLRETHCLDWRWDEKLTTLADQRKHVNSFFHTEQLRHYPSVLTGDSTPSYLIDSRRVIPRLQKVWPHWRDMKFLVMLREPIQRCESHYAMVTSPVGTPSQLRVRGSEWRALTLEQVLQDDLDLLQKCGVIPYWQDEQVIREIYDEFINTEEEYQAWQRYLSHIPLHTGSYACVGRGLYALNLLPWLRVMDQRQFYVVNLEDFSTQPQSVLAKVWKHLDVPHCSTVDATAQNTRAYESRLSTEWKDRLQRFFEPHNERLLSMFGAGDNPWRKCWIYSEDQEVYCNTDG